MINRGDIKLAIDMVVNAQDDNLFGGEAEYVINTLEDCGNEINKLREQVAAQAAVIEKLRESLRTLIALEMADTGATDSDELCCEYQDAIRSYSAIPTDSTQILDEVRRAERERVAKFIEDGDLLVSASTHAAAIRAME